MNSKTDLILKLRTAGEFAYMREQGKKKVGRHVILVNAVAPDQILRWGIVCGKKYHKHAVKRNRARRLIWESVRHLQSKIKLPPLHIVFIPRQAMMNAKEPMVEKEIAQLLSALGQQHIDGTFGLPPKDSLCSSSGSTDSHFQK